MPKIILSGGGTLGPVVPLLAIQEAYKAVHPTTEFIWVGTKTGPERTLVEERHIRFVELGAGKWRRYFSLLNVVDLFKIVWAYFQSVGILLREKPDLVISCGGFVSVPLHWAAWALRIPAWVHQQDVRVGLANKLMFPFAKKVTTALEKTAQQVRGAEWLGNPVRNLEVSDLASAQRTFHIPDAAPVIFALGGGTGSASINTLMLETLQHIPSHWHVIHLTGKERQGELSEEAAKVFPNYHVYPFLKEEMKDAYALASVVVARAGFSTLTELSALKKAAVIMPMFDTHQEENARTFAEQGGVIMLEKGQGTGLFLAQVLKDLIETPEKKHVLGEKLHTLLPIASPNKIVSLINSLLA